MKRHLDYDPRYDEVDDEEPEEFDDEPDDDSFLDDPSQDYIMSAYEDYVNNHY